MHLDVLRRSIPAAFLLATAALGCTAGGDGQDRSGGAPATTAARVDRFRLEDAADEVVVRLKRKDSVWKVEDPAGARLGEIELREDRVKVADAAGTEVYEVKRKDGGAEIEDAGGNRLYRLKRSANGTWKVKDERGETLFKAKPKGDAGYELRDAGGGTIAKIKPRTGQIVFETEAGERLNEIDGFADPMAAMWLALPGLSRLEQAALCVYFLEVDTRR